MNQDEIVPGEVGRPADYHEIKESCANCRSCFVWMEHEECFQYYCTHHADPRPPCGSVLMDESFFKDVDMDGVAHFDTLNYEKRSAAWEAWSMDREIQPNGICSRFEPAGGRDLK
jgi:hypothetical protein